MIRSLLFVSIAALLSFECYAQANAQKSATDTGGAEFTFLNSRVYDFDRIVVGDKATYTFHFRNTGGRPLVITEMNSQQNGEHDPAHQVKVTWPKSTIKPGKTGTIVVSVQAEDAAGSFRNQIYVTSNVTGTNYPLLLIGGAIVPEGMQPDNSYKPVTAAGAVIAAFMVNNIK